MGKVQPRLWAENRARFVLHGRLFSEWYLQFIQHCYLSNNFDIRNSADLFCMVVVCTVLEQRPPTLSRL